MEAITKKSILKKAGIFAVLFALILTLSMPIASFAASAPTIPDGVTDGSITIHKLDRQTSTPVPGTGTEITPPSGAVPLNGVEFSYIKVVPDGDANVEGAVLFTSGGVDYYKDSDDVTGSGTTANLGATYGDGAIYWGGLPLGLYLIHETPLNGFTQVNNFIVSIPTTVHGASGADDTLEFDVHVYPKNSDISVDKDAADPDDNDPTDGTDTTDSLPVAVGDDVDWFITSSIPSGYEFVAGKTAYAITDTPSTGLMINAVEVRLNPTDHGANNGTLLVLGTDYTLTPALPLGDGDAVTVAFTDARLALLQAGDTIQIKVTTEVLDSAAVGATENEAGLAYTNSDGEDFTSGTGDDTPEVFMGGLSFIKVDADTGAGLPGATFKLVEKSSSNFDADFTANGYFEVGGAVTEATSGSDGYFEFKNLPYGLIGEDAATATAKEYWLVETDAPGGYRLIGAATAVPVDGNSYNASLTLAAGANQADPSQIFENFKGFEFPLTGGMGTLLFVVCGIVLIGVAGIVIVSARRKNGKAAQ